MANKEKLWNRNFIYISISNFFVACSFFLLMPTIPIYLSEQLAVPHSQIGIVLSSYAMALLIIRPFSGYWVDVFSRKPLLIIGMTLFVAAYFGYFYAVSVVSFFALRFIHGLFWGLTSVSANTIAIDIIPSSRRAEGIGFFGVNMNLAMALAPFIAVNIYENYGFNALITLALIMGSTAIFFVTRLKVPKRNKLDSIPPISFDRFILVKGIPIFFNQLFLSFGWGTLAAYAVLYGKSINIQNAGIFFLFLASGLVLSRVISGRLVDRGHLHKVMMSAIFLITVGFVGFAEFQNPMIYSISAFVMGLGYGTLFPALQSIYINIAPASKRGTANSTYLTGFDLGIGAGMLVGASLEEHFGFKNMYLLTALLSFIALFLYWFISRKVYEKHKLKDLE